MLGKVVKTQNTTSVMLSAGPELATKQNALRTAPCWAVGRFAAIALNVTVPSLSAVASRISEILTPHFRFAVTPLPPNFSA